MKLLYKILAALTPPPKPITKKQLEADRQKRAKEIVTRVLMK